MSVNNLSNTVRQSPVILMLRIFYAEIILNSIYFFPRVVKLFFQDTLSYESFFVLTQSSLVLYLILVIIQVLVIAYIVTDWVNDMFIIGENDVVHRRGVFSLKEETYSLRNVEAFVLNQSFLGKLFNLGTIHFYSPVLKQEYYLTNISSPSQIKKDIEYNVNLGKQTKSSQMIIPKR